MAVRRRLICPFARGPDSDTRLRCMPFAYRCSMRLRDIMSVGVITVVIGATLDQEHRDEVARKIGMKLGKFASSIERVSVRLFDANGPKGGVSPRRTEVAAFQIAPPAFILKPCARRWKRSSRAPFRLTPFDVNSSSWPARRG